MNLYLLTQDKVSGWDTYDAVVVAAMDHEDAEEIHPDKAVTHVNNDLWMVTFDYIIQNGKRQQGKEHVYVQETWPNWLDRDCINVEYLGPTNKPRGVILASFNAE